MDSIADTVRTKSSQPVYNYRDSVVFMAFSPSGDMPDLCVCDRGKVTGLYSTVINNRYSHNL